VMTQVTYRHKADALSMCQHADRVSDLDKQ
jgi:hypothetical protein